MRRRRYTKAALERSLNDARRNALPWRFGRRARVVDGVSLLAKANGGRSETHHRVPDESENGFGGTSFDRRSD